MWVTNSSLFAPQVRFGFLPDVLKLSASGTTATYAADMMCGPVANTSACARLVVTVMIHACSAIAGFIDPGQVHTVLLTGLLPATQYYYIVRP